MLEEEGGSNLKRGLIIKREKNKYRNSKKQNTIKDTLKM